MIANPITGDPQIDQEQIKNRDLTPQSRGRSKIAREATTEEVAAAALNEMRLPTDEELEAARPKSQLPVIPDEWQVPDALMHGYVRTARVQPAVLGSLRRVLFPPQLQWLVRELATKTSPEGWLRAPGQGGTCLLDDILAGRHLCGLTPEVLANWHRDAFSPEEVEPQRTEIDPPPPPTGQAPDVTPPPQELKAKPLAPPVSSSRPNRRQGVPRPSTPLRAPSQRPAMRIAGMSEVDPNEAARRRAQLERFKAELGFALT